MNFELMGKFYFDVLEKSYLRSMEEIFIKLARQLIPSIVLDSFDIIELDDSKEEELVKELHEKKEKIPLSEKELVLNGFMKAVEFTHFPANGRRCYLRLCRRRWKEKGNPKGKSYFNQYDYTVEGTKATKEFGAFLKEIGAEKSI